jgi:hypothetical protein
MVRYSNGGYTPYAVDLSGTIQPKSTFVVVLDKRDPQGTGLEQPVDSALQAKADLFVCPVYSTNRMMYFNGNDAVSLEKISGGAIVDLIGKPGPPMTADDNGWGSLNDTTITYNSGGVPTEYTIQNYIVGPLFWLSWTENNTLIRKFNVKGGVTVDPDPYFVVTHEWDSVPVNTFDSLGSHNCYCGTLSVNENYIETHTSIYPNPVSNGVFTIEAEESIEEIKIIDVAGKLIDYTELEGQSAGVTISIDDELRGLYFVMIRFSNGQNVTKKILLN